MSPEHGGSAQKAIEEVIASDGRRRGAAVQGGRGICRRARDDALTGGGACCGRCGGGAAVHVVRRWRIRIEWDV